ncbi:MAG: hypothetical protein HFH93_13560 [Lachnospiraceae bacterium]|nr:hypothetical protein [Lachnospiraceae bacterium]
MSSHTIPEATGASIRPRNLIKHKHFLITDFGAREDAAPALNTKAVNSAIQTAAMEGGTVVIPKGTFHIYTILLKSNVNLYLAQGAVLAAARTDIVHSYEKQSGEGGNYKEPEVNLYVGLQDHGHSYFSNSMIYGSDLENVMIYGKGLITGGRFDQESGILEYVLQGGDPAEPMSREAKGHQDEWFGNKGIALVRCENVVLEDFSVTIGGHFAIIAQGCDNLYVNHILVDTTRDAFDIDCCRDVTVRDTVCNSLTDEGLCLKASFGAGVFRPLQNVLIEDCTVCGYDAGSVYAGEYTRDKLIALDRCGPTGWLKFGSEATCGYHLVTIRRVKFDRSRGFCMESVDCSSLTNVIFEDCVLDNVSSSPIFLRAGDRARFPVTGNVSSSAYPALDTNVRLDHRNWVLPNERAYHCYPARRYAPHYNRTKTVTVDGHSSFEIVDPDNPVQCNPANYQEIDGKFYLKTWQSESYAQKDTSSQGSARQNNGAQYPEAHGVYVADLSRELREEDLPLYANAIGSPTLATVSNVVIRNVTITNADPRYPILLMGLTDSHMNNIVLENISVEYRGGLSMEHAVEQRQLNTEWKFSQFHTKERVQNLPWLVNTFFSKGEGLLPRADWDERNKCWKDDPYNVPELPDAYPEPSNWGILPAYGLFAKHVDGLTLRNIRFSCKVPDGRHVCVFDDVADVCVDGMEAYCARDIAPIALVTDHYRRRTNAENVPEQPYFTTGVTGLEIHGPLLLTDDTGHCRPRAVHERSRCVKEVEISAPAPGTPQDSLYSLPTAPCQETGYRYPVDTDNYPLPLTVYRPYIQPVAPVRVRPGESCHILLNVRNPASDISDITSDGRIYNGQMRRPNYSVKGVVSPLLLSCENLPDTAAFDAASMVFSWTPAWSQKGEHVITFAVDDGLMPEKMQIRILVEDESEHYE